MRKHTKVAVGEVIRRIAAVRMGNVGQRLAVLERNRPLLVEYCRMKLDAEDWRGVQDAASDLRDLDNELDGLRY